MYKKSLKKIIKLVEASQELDQLGYTDKSIEALYNAFEIAEDTSYKLANKINNMEKTASKNIKTSRVQELENMVKISQGLGRIIDWIGGKAIPGVSKWLTEKAAPTVSKWFGGKAIPEGLSKEALETAKKAEPWLARKFRGLGETFGGAGKDITRKLGEGEKTLSRFIRTPADKERALKAIQAEKAALNSGGAERLGDPAYLKRLSELDAQKAKIEALKPGLTDLGKLTAGTAGIGAAGALAFGREKEPIFETTPYGKGGGIPTGGGVGGMPTGIPGGGVTTGIPTGVSTGVGVGITPEINQRLSNLEQIVQAIRMKVGI